MDDELNLDEVDNVSAGYSNAQMALQQKITTLEGYLKNPNKDITHIMGKKLDFERLSEGFDFEKYINLILK